MKTTPNSNQPTVATVAQTVAKRIGNYRWRICALLFVAATINYLDRQVLGILAPQLQESIGWSEMEYGYIVMAFQLAYAIGYAGMGSVMDWLGTRKGFSLAIIVWSIAAMGHALARSAFGFGIARFALGLGEAGNFPASVKTVAEWFPKKERAFAVGLFNSGTNIGAFIAPLVVPFMAINFGWQWAFILTGALGFIWLFFWMRMYRSPAEHPRVSADELAHIQSDPADPDIKVPYLRLLSYRQTWAFAVGKFMTDPIWWFYLYWLPKFLNSSYGLTLDKIGLPLIIIYLFSDVGSIAGGWLSSHLIKRGWSVNAARKTTMLICAGSVAPIYFASVTSDLWTSVALISLATAAHQGWSANLFTLTSDMFPRHAVGSVVGIGGMSGAFGGMLVATAAGYLLETTGSYIPLFMVASLGYLITLLFIHLLVPQLSVARLKGEGSGE